MQFSRIRENWQIIFVALVAHGGLCVTLFLLLSSPSLIHYLDYSVYINYMPLSATIFIISLVVTSTFYALIDLTKIFDFVSKYRALTYIIANIGNVAIIFLIPKNDNYIWLFPLLFFILTFFITAAAKGDRTSIVTYCLLFISSTTITSVMLGGLYKSSQYGYVSIQTSDNESIIGKLILRSSDVTIVDGGSRCHYVIQNGSIRRTALMHMDIPEDIPSNENISDTSVDWLGNCLKGAKPPSRSE